MDFLLPFVIGLIVGWLIKWIFDRISSPAARVGVQAQEPGSGRLAAAEQRIQELQSELRAASDKAAAVVVKEKDRLERIHGIGPVFAQRLNAAGIHTFSELAEMTPDRVHDIISPKDWQAIDPPGWIGEARDLALSPKP